MKRIRRVVKRSMKCLAEHLAGEHRGEFEIMPEPHRNVFKGPQYSSVAEALGADWWTIGDDLGKIGVSDEYMPERRSQ